MHAERMFAVLQDVDQELRALKIGPRFLDVVKSLEAVVQPRPGPTSQEIKEAEQAGEPRPPKPPSPSESRARFETELKWLSEALHRAPSNHFVPSQIRILEALSLWGWTGTRLLNRVESALEAGPLDADATLRSVRVLWEAFSKVRKTLDATVGGLASLGLKKGRPAPETAEIGVLLPLPDPTVDQIQGELREFDKRFRVFPELVGETPQSFRVTSISTGSVVMTLATVMSVGWIFAKALKEVLEVVDRVLEIKMKWRGLKAVGFREELGEDEIKEYVKGQLDELREELLEVYPGPADRRNELRNFLTTTLGFVMDRITRGAVFEVRFLPPPNPEDADDEIDLPGFTNLADFRDMGAAMRDVSTNGSLLDLDVLGLLEPPSEDGTTEEDESDDESEEPPDGEAEETGEDEAD